MFNFITRNINMSCKNAINDNPMKYHNFLSEKCVNTLNNNNNNVKIAVKSQNNSI